MITGSSFEANIVRHCNKRCAGCSHASPWAKLYLMSPEVLERDLNRLLPFFHSNQFWLLGGEPLLHPDILSMIDVARKSCISDMVGIITNGTRLDRVPEEFWSRIDFLRISAYPDLDPKMLEIANSKSKQYGCGLGIDQVVSFFKQLKINPGGGSFFNCPWKDHCWVVHDGFMFLCPSAAFFPSRFMDIDPVTDGIPLDETLTEEKLKAFLDNRNVPFKTCSICESFSVQMPWHEVKTEEEWLRDSTI